MNADQIISEVAMLPIEQRIHIVDSLLKSLNSSDTEIDPAWLDVSRVRRDEFRSDHLRKSRLSGI